jgi:hypothetical protein
LVTTRVVEEKPRKLNVGVVSERSNFEQSQTNDWEQRWQVATQEVKAFLGVEEESILDPQRAEKKFLREGFGFSGGMMWLDPGTAKTAVEFTPFAAAARYAFPSEQRKLEAMTEDERASAIWWSVFGTAMWGAGKSAMRWMKEGKELWHERKAAGLLKMQPVEDAVSSLQKSGGRWQSFDYDEGMRKWAKGKGFAKDELDAVKAAAQGDVLPAKVLAYEKRLKGEKMSKGWQKSMVTESKAYGGPELKPEELAAVSEQSMRSKHYSKLYMQNATRLGVHAEHANQLVRAQARKFFGEELGSKIDLRSLDEVQASNLIANMVSPEGYSQIARWQRLGADKWALPWIHPIRKIMGASEEVYQTLSKIHVPLLEAKTNATRYTVDKMKMFAQMLEQRGYGKVVSHKHKGFRFVPNKDSYSEEITQAAYRFLKKSDDLFAEAKRATNPVHARNEARKAQLALYDELGSESPKALGLIDTVYRYQDMLYKEHVLVELPKILNSYRTTKAGDTLIKAFEKKWGPQVEQAFSTKAGWTYDQKATKMKEMFKELSQMLDTFGTRMYRPGGRKVSKLSSGVKRIGKGSAQEVVMQVKSRLSYGNKFPEYVEGYLPRFYKANQGLEAHWGRVLTGEPRAGYTKGRKLDTAKERVYDFATLIEARTRAQGKQLYMMQEIGDVVTYARTLPESLKKYTDFLISRAMGRPGKVDEVLATVISKYTPTNPYQVMHVAQSLNSLAYGGLLGFRPFSAFRNLTQPALLGIPEYGSLGKGVEGLARGYVRAAQGGTRKYLREIGIITDYIPEQQTMPIMPTFAKGKLGKLGQKYKELKDVSLWMFRESDRMNRYVSGGMALSKWDDAMAVAGKDPQKFMKAIEGSKIERWDRVQIEELMIRGKWDDAKAHYVKRFVADTQYLYGQLEAPQALGMGGATKTLTQFQSWWMNYEDAIVKWATTGAPQERIERMMSWMAISATMSLYLTAAHGERIGSKTAGLGPLPNPADVRALMPPMLSPVVDMASVFLESGQDGLNLAKEIGWERTFDRLGRAASDTATMVVPGGLQMKQLYRGYQDDDIKGALKALGNIK